MVVWLVMCYGELIELCCKDIDLYGEVVWVWWVVVWVGEGFKVMILKSDVGVCDISILLYLIFVIEDYFYKYVNFGWEFLLFLLVNDFNCYLVFLVLYCMFYKV